MSPGALLGPHLPPAHRAHGPPSAGRPPPAGARSGPHLLSCLPSSTSTKPSPLNHSPGKACLLLWASVPQTQKASSRIHGACSGLLPVESDTRHDSCFHRKFPTSLCPWLHPMRGVPTAPPSLPAAQPHLQRQDHAQASFSMMQPSSLGLEQLPPCCPHTPGGRLRAPPSRDRCPAPRHQCRLPTPLPTTTSCQTLAPTSSLLSAPPHPPHPGFFPTALPVRPNVGLQPQPHRLAPTPPPIS